MCLEAKRKEKLLDSVFDAFADQRRRLVIGYLREAPDGVASYDDLVDYVSKHVLDTKGSEKLKNQLHHVTLPKLENVGVIEYDRRSETVRYQSLYLVDGLAEFIEDIESDGKM